jgi:hypothetical protein
LSGIAIKRNALTISPPNVQGIAVKPLYTQSDLDGLGIQDEIPGIGVCVSER